MVGGAKGWGISGLPSGAPEETRRGLAHTCDARDDRLTWPAKNRRAFVIIIKETLQRRKRFKPAASVSYVSAHSNNCAQCDFIGILEWSQRPLTISEFKIYTFPILIQYISNPCVRKNKYSQM